MQLMTYEQFESLAKRFRRNLSEAEGNAFFEAYAKRLSGTVSSDRYSEEPGLGDSKEVLRSIMALSEQYRDNMGFVDRGSSRVVFSLFDGTALKVAFNIPGVAQNRREVQVIQNDGDNKLLCFPKVYDSMDNYQAILVDCVRPLVRRDFENMFGLEFERVAAFFGSIARVSGSNPGLADSFDFSSGLDDVKVSVDPGELVKMIASYDSAVNKEFLGDMKDFSNIQAVSKFMGKLFHSKQLPFRSLRVLAGLCVLYADISMADDLYSSGNWGITESTEDGTKYPVVVDIGFSDAIYRDFY